MRTSVLKYVSQVQSSKLFQLDREILRRKLAGMKNQKEDDIEITGCGEEECVKTFSSEQTQQCPKSSGRRQRTSKAVHFRVLPDRYEPLEEDRTSDTTAEESHKKKQKKYKRFRKNLVKGLRYTWKCLLIGLQSFSMSYSGPLSAASTLVPEIHRTKPRV